MATKFYGDLWEIEDSFRRRKYQALILSSLQNDLTKWTQQIKSDRSIYLSPDYNGSKFIIEIRNISEFAYILYTSAAPIQGRSSELIYDNINNSSDIKKEVSKLRETIYSPDVYEIEKLIGKQHDRKEKLIFLDLEQMKETIEDTYQDWLKSDDIVVAKMIAKIMYSYRKKEEFFNLWKEKFGDIELIKSELNKLKG